VRRAAPGGLQRRTAARAAVLKTFLRENLYHHYQVLRMTDKARRIIQDLFGAFMNDPRLLPPQYQQMARSTSRGPSPTTSPG
jgi:dGTP triphosphohydrolase